MAVATYPGTVSPLRGLDPFGEAERDVWHGRESERDEIAKLVTADGFRAGLVYGEPGVGKTSLVRAGLIPYLRDHGIVALACEDLGSPAQSFASGLSSFGIQPNAGEAPVAFATRAVSNAVQGQQFVFVVDDIDLLCADDKAVGELSDLFSRVVSRSGGRARFLFICASERQHLLGALERRTGSLFPPSARYELPRITAQAASGIFDRMLSLSGVAADPPLADAVVQGISRGQPLLAADLQISAMAMRDLKVTSLAALQKVGGPTELESLWLHEACKATGNERSALRLCAELAATGHVPRTAESVVKRINLDMAYAQHALNILETKGVIIRADPAAQTWVLRHEVLTQRVRELTAPARAAARRGFDLLGSKTQNKERLNLRELRALRTEGIAAVTPDEQEVLDRSKRYYMMIAAAIAAAPLVILIIIWFSMRGRVYFDLEPQAGGDRIVVRGGRAGLSSFHWLPGGFGDEIADTGLTRPMVAAEKWKQIEGHDIGGSRADWDDLLPSLMDPQLAGLVDYATTGNEKTLEALKAAAKDPEDLAELLTALRPIARGTPTEVALVEAALKTPSPAVQRAAVAVAGAAAQRGDAYQDTLAQTLISPDSELRRIAFSSVRSLGERGRALFAKALDANPDSAARRELLVEVSTVNVESTPSAANAVAVLSDPDASPALRDRAKTQIRGALASAPDAAAAELVKLVAQDRAPAEARIYAIGLLRELDPLPKNPDLVEAARTAFASRSAGVRAAALPLYAKADPERAGGDLSTMLEDKKLDKSLRVAAALAWGEVAPTAKGAAENALDRMLKDPDDEVRAAAAAASGKAGRAYQDRLVKMAKAENYVVRIGAAQGLAASAESGGSVGVAVGGISQLWREKGRPRRDAARVMAHLAKKKPGAVIDYLSQAARIQEDPALHPIGVEGLCNAALAGSAEARRLLARSTDDPSVDVRRLVMSCVADGPDAAKNGVTIAAKLIGDQSSEIRADAARVLAMSAQKGNKGVGDALVKMLDDPDREVRLVAVRAIGTLAADAPKSAQTVMAKMFERGDEAEKLALVRAAKQIGAAELIGIAVADSSPLVRVEAVDAALASGLRAGATLSAALADPDPQVRKAALERLAAQKDKLEPAVLDRTLALAVRDPNPELSQLALTTIARVAAKDAVVARLHRSLGSRAERERAQAAAAAIGLVDRDAALAVQLLEPLLDDPSHDVRVAMLPALGAAYAKTNEPEKLADILRDSEANAMRRLVVAAAFITLAKTDAGRAATESSLGKVVKDGPPMARQISKLVGGLVGGKADGMAFLQELVP
ncbi:MAG: AAA family ATPase [Deltaproteobacteria bacterium]|nr:AAA family ATPase [Deltaproteobacteria bacterium]